MEYRPKLQRESIPFYGEVKIHHPGYSNDRVLFAFPAYDPVLTPPEPAGSSEPAVLPAPESAAKGGVNHRLVLDACRVITNNQEGHLTTDIAGTSRVPIDTAILLAGDYYLHLTEGLQDYEIVTEFAAWVFPGKEAFPAHWARNKTPREERDLKNMYGKVTPSAMSNHVKADDRMCIVSAFTESLDNAYLLPKEELPWFNMQKMYMHNHNRQASINDTANGMTLRSDIHRCLDAHGFVFYPCEPRNHVVYIVGDAMDDYAHYLHRRLVDMPHRVADKFLYARFAYAVIHLLLHDDFWEHHSYRIPESISQYERKTNKMREDAGETRVQDSAPRSLQESGTLTSCDSLPELLRETEEDREYTESWHFAFPDYAEVDDPPDTSDIQIWTHPDDPRIERLTRAYRAENPQIAMCSASLPLQDADGGLFRFDD